MTVRGSIPEKLMYVCAKPMTLRDGGEGLNAGCEGQNVTPAFVTDADNKKTIDTGYSWAKRTSNNYRYGSDRDKNYEPQFMPRKNDPLTEIKVVELERRTQGGRAYKVIHRGGYLVDMREDVLMDVIFNEGIGEGGVLKGEFIWARHNTEMKLVRIGSKLHKDLLEATERKKEKKIPNKDLEYGGIYETAGGTKAVYLGRVDCEEAHCYKNRGFNTPYYNSSGGASVTYNSDTNYEIIEKGSNIHGFCEMHSYEKGELSWYHIKLKKTHSFVRKIGKYDGDPIEALHKEGMKHAVKYGTSKHQTNYGKFYGECCGFNAMSIRPTGEPLPEFIEENYPDFYKGVVKTCHPMFKK